MPSEGNADEDEISDDNSVEDLVRVLDKEEKEMDEGNETDEEEDEALEKDVEIIEETMEEEIAQVSKVVKPVHQVLFKVCTHFFSLSLARYPRS